MTSQAALWAVVSVLGVLVIVLTIMVVGLLRRAAPILERAEQLLSAGATSGANVLEGLAVGAKVEPFVAADRAGDRAVGHQILGGETRALVVLLSTHCDPCLTLSRQMTNENWGMLESRLVVIQSIEPGASPLPVCPDAELPCRVLTRGHLPRSARTSPLTPSSSTPI